MLELASDDWWEVKAQLLAAASSLLTVVGEDHPRCVDVRLDLFSVGRREKS